MANNPEYADILEQFRNRISGLIKEFSRPNHGERILDLPRTVSIIYSEYSKKGPHRNLSKMLRNNFK
ncbi:hypothetical protein AN643_02035 [Candidatus Epulonipiscioides saccharophilum]|nr:hypothetical protein AN643_02035 [Epulopiscium sp. SCG-B10WGA-EpuloB]